MSTALVTLTGKLAAKLDMGEDGRELIDTLKQTAFKGNVSDAQMTALLIVANQYGLNPWTKEIYAFPDKNNGVVPVVGVDGWSRIINSHHQFDGIEFEQDKDSCTCKIYRKDRSHPTVVTEFMDECSRNTAPWNSHPRRMLRHKAMIQCARLAFGFGGIYDQDDAEVIAEKDMGEATRLDRPTTPAELPEYPQERFNASFSAWQGAVERGKLSVDDLLAKIGSAFRLTSDQTQQIEALRDCATIEGESA